MRRVTSGVITDKRVMPGIHTAIADIQSHSVAAVVSDGVIGLNVLGACDQAQSAQVFHSTGKQALTIHALINHEKSGVTLVIANE